MARVKNKLVTKQMAWHANMTELNHLGASLHARPAQFEGKMAEIFSSKKYFSDNSLTSSLIASGREREITSNEWEWGLKTASTKPLVVLENVLSTAITAPGSGRTNFNWSRSIRDHYWSNGTFFFCSRWSPRY